MDMQGHAGMHTSVNLSVNVSECVSEEVGSPFKNTHPFHFI